MDEKILKKLQQRVDRRSFLRGSGLAAAALAGVTAFPFIASAQDPAKPEEAKKEEQKEEKKEEKKEAKKDEKAEEKNDDKKEEGKDAKKEPDPFKVTKKDEQGRDYRLCPQCGYNMYKQDRTWTCENCGYSYTE